MIFRLRLRIRGAIVILQEAHLGATRKLKMPDRSDPRVLFAAERTLLAWQRSSLALMGFGFLVERFSEFVPALRHQPERPWHHLVALFVGVLLILLGSGVAIAAGIAYRQFVASLPQENVPTGYWTGLAAVITLIVGIVGFLLAGYLLFTGDLLPPSMLH